MLGWYVYKYISQFENVKCINRNKFDILKNSYDDLELVFKENVNNVDDIVINCAGLIPQTLSINEIDFIIIYIFNFKSF